MFDRTDIHTGGPSHITHEHHLAPTAEHLRLLKEYREQAVEETKKEWYQGNLRNVGFGEVHARRWRHEARREDAVEVSFNVEGKLHQMTVAMPDDVLKKLDEEDYIDCLVRETRRQLAVYIVEHILLDKVLTAALLPPSRP